MGNKITLIRSQNDLRDILEDSPSLRNYLLEILHQSYQDALKNVGKEYDVIFPNEYPFSLQIDSLLSGEFWSE